MWNRVERGNGRRQTCFFAPKPCTRCVTQLSLGWRWKTAIRLFLVHRGWLAVPPKCSGKFMLCENSSHNTYVHVLNESIQLSDFSTVTAAHCAVRASINYLIVISWPRRIRIDLFARFGSAWHFDRILSISKELFNQILASVCVHWLARLIGLTLIAAFTQSDTLHVFLLGSLLCKAAKVSVPNCVVSNSLRFINRTPAECETLDSLLQPCAIVVASVAGGKAASEFQMRFKCDIYVYICLDVDQPTWWFQMNALLNMAKGESMN